VAVKQVGTFGSLPITGIRFDLTRGARANYAQVRAAHYKNEDLSNSSTLVLKSNSSQISFTGMVADLASLRPDCNPEHLREWVFGVWDRRAKWRNYALNGDYNVRYRDCTVKPVTQKTLGQLYDTALQAVGEAAGTYLSGANIYPAASWRNENAVCAIESLGVVYPAFVCPTAQNTFTVAQGGTGSEPPNTGQNPTLIPDYKATLERGPIKIIARCGPTLYQCFLELEAVGRDTDGDIKLIDDLSYKPSGGWAAEHPLFFSGVAIGNRHLALKTVFRMYRVKVQSVPGCTKSITDVLQFDLDDYLVSMAGTGNYKEVIPAFIKGQFWPYSHRYVNTGSCVHWAGDFTIDNEQKCVLFEVPVFKAGSCVTAASLWLCTGFRVRDPSTWDFVRKEFSADRTYGVGHQVIDCPWLWETVIESYLLSCANSGSPTKNTSTIQTEADIITAAWKTYWDDCRTVRDIPYFGTLPVPVGGRVAMVGYEVFGGRAPKTRVCRGYIPTGQ